MKWSNQHAVEQARLWLVGTMILAVGCGTMVGNPKKPVGDSPAVDNTVNFPSFDLAIPAGIVEDEFALNLTGSSPKTGPVNKLKQDPPGNQFSVLHINAKLLDINIKSINNAIQAVRDEGIDELGDFAGKGLGQEYSGRIAKLLNDSTYDFEATICHKGNKFLYLKFDETGDNISAVYDYSSIVFIENILEPEAARASLVQTLDPETGIKSYNADSQGEFNGWLGILGKLFTDGNQMLTHNDLTKDKEGVLTLKGIMDWSDDLAASREGDTYLTGRLAADGSGEYVGYNKYSLLRCKNRTFDENDPELWTYKPLSSSTTGWCLGRQIGTSDDLAGNDFQGVLDRLEPIGVSKVSELKTIDFPASANCGNAPEPEPETSPEPSASPEASDAGPDANGSDAG